MVMRIWEIILNAITLLKVVKKLLHTSVDDMYHLIYNDNPYFYGRDTFNQLNELWYKYKLDD